MRFLFRLQMTVARSLAAMISEPTAEKFIPNVFDGGVVDTVFNAVLDYIKQEKTMAEEGT